MKVNIESPIKAFLEETTPEEMVQLTKLLSYTNTAAAHQLKRHQQNRWFKTKNPEGWEAHSKKLKDSVHNTLIFEENGRTFIRPASLPYLVAENVDCYEHTNKITYPTPKKIAWAKPLPFQLHPYQEQSWQELLKIKHGNVQLCTGAGKSAILLKLCRETGFKTAIIAPSKSIFSALVKDFDKYLGKGNTGRFGDGKKVLDKKFTVCIGDSLANVKPNTPEWEFFSKMDMILVDESHMWGADSLESVCHGVFSEVPYRFFLSGTQTRGDGGEKLLQSIIGRTVYTLSTQEAVAGGYICPHDFKIVSLESSNPNYSSQDALEMKRVHFLSNKNIAAFVAKLANAEATTHRRQTLVLVEELHQISMLMKLLTVPTAYAHSESKPERLRELGLEKVDTDESVEKFNKNEVQVLIGTGCISVGTNIYPTHNTVNWVGGASEIKTKQGTIGRSVRLSNQNPWKDKCLSKDKCTIWDFNVVDCFLMQKHLKDRILYYKESGSEIKVIKLK